MVLEEKYKRQILLPLVTPGSSSASHELGEANHPGGDDHQGGVSSDHPLVEGQSDTEEPKDGVLPGESRSPMLSPEVFSDTGESREQLVAGTPQVQDLEVYRSQHTQL